MLLKFCKQEPTQREVNVNFKCVLALRVTAPSHRNCVALFLSRYLFKDSFSHLTFDSLQINFFRHYFFRIQFNSEEQWTKALKFVLTNLKRGLAWVSSQFTDKWWQQACHATLINLIKRILSLKLEILHLRFSCVLCCHVNQVVKQPRYQGQVKKETFGTKLVEHLLDMLPSGNIVGFSVKRK